MEKYNFIKPNTFIKDLPQINELNPQHTEDFEKFLYDWVERWVPVYEEMKRKNADVFEFKNHTSKWIDRGEVYENNGLQFIFDPECPLWGRLLSFSYDTGLNCNWRNCFWNEYPQYHGSNWKNWRENYFYTWYFLRYYKKDAKYNLVQDRVKEYFRFLTKDPEIIFDLGWTTYIYWNPDKRWNLDRFPCWYY